MDALQRAPPESGPARSAIATGTVNQAEADNNSTLTYARGVSFSCKCVPVARLLLSLGHMGAFPRGFYTKSTRPPGSSPGKQQRNKDDEGGHAYTRVHTSM